MKKFTKVKWFGIFLVIISIGLLAGCGQKEVSTGDDSVTQETDQDLAFYDGKTVNIVVPHGAGGGYDIYARSMAPYLQKYLPGSTVLVDNRTGAGGLIGRNAIYTAKPDGLTLGFTSITGTLLAEWSGGEGVNYKTHDFSWIARVYYEPHILVVSKQSKYKSINEIIAAGKLTVGFSGVGSDDYYMAIIAGETLGFNVEPVTGYSGSNEANLGAVRGETEAVQTTYSSIRASIEAGDVIPVLVFANERMTELPEVPTVFEKVQDEDISALVSLFELDRVLFAPPNVPEGRLNVLREAYEKVVNDPEYQSVCTKTERPIKFLSGEDTSKLLDNIDLAEERLKPRIVEVAENADK